MIKWKGQNTSKTITWEVECENAVELVDILISKGIIEHYENEFSSLNFELSYFMELWEVEDMFDLLNNYMTDLQILTCLSCCQGNAYYQEYEII